MGTKRSTGVGLHVEGAEKFRADLNKANSAIKQTNAEVKKLDAAYGKGSTGSDYLTQRTKALTTQLDNQRKKTAALKGELELYQSSGKTTTAQLEKYRLEILKSETAEAQLTREIREANDALNAQKLTADKVAKTLDGYATKAGKVGDSLTRALTLPIAGMGTYTLNAAMELEDAMKTVATLPGVVSGSVEQQAAQLEEYTDAVREASDVTHVAAEDLAMAQYSAISAGASAAESVYMVERSAKAAKAGLSDVETVIDGATSALNAWGDAAGGIDHVLDAMIVAQNEGKTTVGDLASQIGQVTGLAPALGVALDEVLAAVAALTKGGVQTSSAINGLKAVMSNVMKPTAEAREEAKKLGLEFSATALQAQGLTGFLESVMDATNGDSESLAKLFGSVEGLSQIMALGTTQAEEYARILDVIGASTGVVDEAFAMRTSSKAEQLSGSLNRLRNSGSQLAENLFPAVDAVTDLIGGAADVIGDMDEGTQKALVNVLGVAAAIGPATKAVAGLTSAVAKLIPLLTGPWGLAAAGVVVAGGITLALANAKDSADRLEDTVENMELSPNTESLSALKGTIQDAIDAVDGEKLVQLTASVTANYDGVDAEFDAVTKGIQAKLDATMEDLRVTWNEYAELTGSLNGEDMLGYAQKVYRTGDAEMSAVAVQMIGAIDDANALLRKMYTSGESVTEAEVQQLNELLGQIGEYRLKLTGAWEEAEIFAQSVRREMNAALEDNRLSMEEYEAIKRRIDEEVRPDAVAAMEDAVTSTLGAELETTLAEFETLLATINAHGGEATADEIAQINAYLDQIEQLQARIAELQLLDSAVGKALEDRKLELEEYEAIKRRIDEEARPDAVAAMEDAATASIGSELDATLTEFEGLLKAINDRGGDVAEDEIARINQYLTEIEALNARIDELQGLNAAINTVLAEDPAYQLTLSGYGTDETMAEALGTTEGLRRWQHDELKARRVAIHDKYVQDASMAGSDEEKSALHAEYEAQIAALEAEANAIDANAQKNINALFEGWLNSNEDYQQDAAEIDAIGRLIELYSDMASADSSSEAFKYLYEAGALNWQIRPGGATYAKLSGLAGDDGLVLPYDDIVNNPRMRDGVSKAASQLYNLIPNLISGKLAQYDGEDNPLITMYQSMLDAGIPIDSLDVTQASGTLADILRLYLLKEQGMESMGSEAMEAIGSGIVEAAPEAVEDAEQAVKDISGAATDLPDGTEAGRGLAASLAAGITAGTPAAVAAAQSLAAQVSAALSGMQTYSPGATIPAGATAAGGSSYDFSTNVQFGAAYLSNTADASGWAERLNTLSRLKRAGVGQIARE